MVALGRTRAALVQPRELDAARAQRLQALFEEQAAFVWRTLRRAGLSAVDVEDAMQEVFMVVHRRFAAYEERDALRGWLYAICTRVARSHRRRSHRRREQVVPEPPEGSMQPVQQLQLEQQEALALGERLLQALPEKQRTVFLLYEVEHMSMAEVAEAVGCPLQTAYARLHKARARVLSEVARAQRTGRLP